MLAPLPFTGQRGIASTKRQRQRDKFSKKQPYSSHYLLLFLHFSALHHSLTPFRPCSIPVFYIEMEAEREKVVTLPTLKNVSTAE